jgi:hypothetical protein
MRFPATPASVTPVLICDAVNDDVFADLNTVVVTQPTEPSSEQLEGDGVSDPATPARVTPALMLAAVVSWASAAL